MALRFLVVEGNARAERETHRRHFGTTYAEGWAALLSALVPGCACDIVCPADEDARLPDAGGLEGWDGVFLTGSALNLYDGGPAVARQIDLMRAVYAAGTPAFGSCWGLQVGAAAAGGTVVRNPAGREVGFARRIVPTPAGREHPMLADRPAAFEAPAVHLDIVETAPEGTTVLAGNRLAPIQAAEIRHDGGLFWGVQYHPEFSLSELAAIVDRLAEPLTREGFFADVAGVSAFAADLRALDADPGRGDLAWRHGIDAEVLDPTRRTAEIARFVAHAVVPAKAARGRA